MYLLYVDESGDPGTSSRSPVRYYILSGIVMHELNWLTTLENLIEFRRSLRDSKGLKLREEIHAVNFVNRPGELNRIKRNDRVDILKKCVDWLNTQTHLSVITVVIDKSKNKNEDIFTRAWTTLLTRFENTIQHGNFQGPSEQEDRGLVIPDNTDGKKLQMLLRRLRRYNPVPNRLDIYGGGYRNMPLLNSIEDPYFKNSIDSFIIQMVDIVAYCARQIYEPNKYMKQKGGHNFYRRLNGVLVYQASPRNSLGIVEL